MKKIVTLSSLIVLAFTLNAQEISGKLKFTQGQVINIQVDLKSSIAQQAMGRAIDFNIEGGALHSYKVTNTNEDNSTLHHDMKRITFSFDGMGQTRNFDSNNPKDLEGQFGKPIKDALAKTYDMIIDPSGTVKMTIPEKIDISASDDRIKIITNMLKDVLDVIQPPKKGFGSFFRVLPETAKVGDSWTESLDNELGKFSTTYVLNSITDSTVVVDFTGTSTTITKAEMMGMPTTTTMNNKSTGTIILDRATNIIRSKKIITESNGTTEAMGGTLPVTSKTEMNINVIRNE